MLKNEQSLPSRRMCNGERESLLLQKAVELAEKQGYRNLTGPKVASAAGLRSHGQIYYYFGNMDCLKNWVMWTAVRDGNIEILLQGLVTKDPIALSAPVHLRNAAIEKLRNE